MVRVTFSEHDSEAGSWRIARLEPGPPADIGAFYAYDERGTSFRRRRELPDGSAVLIFHLRGKLRVEHPAGARQEVGEGHGFYSGASPTYVVTETDGALMQAATLKLGSRREIASGLAFAFRRLHRADVGIADVAHEIGMSRERFSRAYRREFGMSPKAFARVRRFAHTLHIRQQEPSLTGAALAADCGYVDQAHMIHDFQEFSGSPPSKLWRQELPDAGGFTD